jgi:23S rRNA (uracil1939-C5)-methyltransferase
VGVLYVNKAVQERLWPSIVSAYPGAVGLSKTFESFGQRDEPSLIAFGEALRFQMRLGRPAIQARARELAEACARSARILVTWGTRGPASAPLALADGAPRLASTIELGGLKLRVGFDSFLQADPEAAERLYEAAEEGLRALPGQRVIDGYAGIGALACRLARRGVRVTAVESHPGAASDLRANGAAAGGEPVHVLELPAERVDWRRPRPDAVVVNPPRTGCAAAVIDSIVRSTARRLVYISCDPTTLARDVRRLGDGWRLDSIRAFDLFPQTAHVETVSVLVREAVA